jgi:hypothetical protein
LEATVDEKATGTTRQTLADLGARLPFGVESEGAFHTELACKRWTFRQEREVDTLKKGGKKGLDFPSRLLSFMLTRFGPHNFEELKEPEKLAILGRSWMGDVMYAYIWLRNECIGSDFYMDLECPHCNAEIPFKADLNTLEVRCAESLEQVQWEYQVRDPFELRGSKFESLVMGPCRWSAIQTAFKEARGKGGGTGGLKQHLILGGIAEIEGRGPTAIVERDLWDMSKYDLELLFSEIEEHEVGPDLSISHDCDHCERRIYTSIDWGYESFFGLSSRSQRGRTD